MLCVNPFRPRPGVEHGCGQCMSCRVNRRRMWTARILLEASIYRESSFVTLTYSDEHLRDGSLSDVHWRQLTKGLPCRYFGVGEYGERSWRPHYHLIAFGVPRASAQALFSERWPYGFVHVGYCVTQNVAQYVSAYTTKGLTNGRSEHVQSVLADLPPEFARMSRRPALGWSGLQFLASWLASDGRYYLEAMRDVPQSVSFGGKPFPLGRTLVAKLRELCDIPPDDPVRRERRESELRVIAMEPVLAAHRESLRYSRYDVYKARVHRSNLLRSI